MDNIINIYHGSCKIIEKPEFGLGKKNNDFGLGFYCTSELNLAKEWAVSEYTNGFSNCYSINLSYMNVLNLNSDKYTILNWIAVLVEHRLFSLNNPIARRAKQYLIDNFSVNVNAYDIIIGYRADDSYFDYANAFLNNSITLEQLALAMKLGKLGEQIVIKSKYAFDSLKFLGYEIADRNVYYQKKKNRNDYANEAYLKILNKEEDGLFIQDIIRGEIKNDDPRIPRNVYRND
jgi:hypothetical protein